MQLLSLSQHPLNLSFIPQPKSLMPHFRESQHPLNLSNRQQPLPHPPLSQQALFPWQALSHGLWQAGGQALAGGQAGAGQASSTHVGTILHTVTVSWQGTHSVTHRVAW